MEDSLLQAGRLGARSVGTEHLLLSLFGAEVRRGRGPLLSHGVTLEALTEATLRHLGVTALPTRETDASPPASFTPKAMTALLSLEPLRDERLICPADLFAAILAIPGWSGYAIFEDLGLDVEAIRAEVGLPALATTRETAGRLVTFPGGPSVRACSLADRLAERPDRDFGLYFDPRWSPRWPASVVDWPDFSVPADAEGAAREITAAFELARSGQRVEIGCAGGLGRTGTALACMAILAGVAAEKAVGWVRQNYDRRAVETADQQSWVRWFAEWQAKA